MSPPAITVLMTVYNEERFLRQAIDSILAQTYSDFELLVVDDASTDSSPTILASYTDPRVRVVTNEENMGCPRSSNRGLALARGQYIARMDADDIAYPHRLAVQHAFLERHPGIDLVGSSNELIDEEGKVIGAWRGRFGPETVYYLLNFRNCLTHSTVMFRKEFAESIGGYNERVKWALDYDFYHRASKAGKLYRMDEVLVQWRSMPAKSQEKSRGQKETVYAVLRDNFSRLNIGEIDHSTLAILNNQKILNEGSFSYNEIKKALSTLFLANKIILEKAPEFLSRLFLIGAMIVYLLFFVGNIFISWIFVTFSRVFGSISKR
ncbi:glycosyltransferase [Methanocalculus sp.]|uniref:glycosyltransferase n=1 Tax=Methanocalculus sp. TaxID=2004547 RepID=UPI002609E78A|nr:glycosyltransferase [Methanocalculus sp.]MDG6249253.1 glycosyltransferase [Methanocalculus sp.]